MVAEHHPLAYRRATKTPPAKIGQDATHKRPRRAEDCGENDGGRQEKAVATISSAHPHGREGSRTTLPLRGGERTFALADLASARTTT